MSDMPLANGVEQTLTSDVQHGKSYRTTTQARIQMRQQSGTNAKALSVPIEDVAAKGIHLRYPRFVHLGTECELELITLHGAWLHVKGVVCTCRYIQDGDHLVGIRFHEAIDVSAICPAAIETKAVLYTASSFLPQLLELWFRHRNVSCKALHSPDQIREVIDFKADLVIVDSMIGEVPGPQLVQDIRTAAYFGLVAGLVASEEDESAAAFLDSGAESVITKPPDEKRILGLVDQSCSEATFSDHAADPRTKELLRHAVRTMREQVEDIASAIREKEFTAIPQALTQISDISMTCGFLDISKLVNDLNTKLEDGGENAVAMIAPLVRLVRAASV